MKLVKKNLITDTILDFFDIVKKSSIHLGSSIDVKVANILSHHGTEVVDSKSIGNFCRNQRQKQGLNNRLGFRVSIEGYLKCTTDPDANTNTNELEGNCIHVGDHQVNFLVEKVCLAHFCYIVQ